jgi:hypothetical protein
MTDSQLSKETILAENGYIFIDAENKMYSFLENGSGILKLDTDEDNNDGEESTFTWIIKNNGDIIITLVLNSFKIKLFNFNFKEEENLYNFDYIDQNKKKDKVSFRRINFLEKDHSFTINSENILYFIITLVVTSIVFGLTLHFLISSKIPIIMYSIISIIISYYLAALLLKMGLIDKMKSIIENNIFD